MGWIEYMNRYRRGHDPSTIGRHIDVHHSTVRRWLSGESQPEPLLARRFARVYGGNVVEAYVALGLLTPEEAGRVQISLAEAVDSESRLSLGRKAHVKEQIEMLIDSDDNRIALAREHIERDTTINRETREQLLAALDVGAARQIDEATPHGGGAGGSADSPK